MIKRLAPYLKPLWARLVAAIICMAGVAAISTGTMWLLRFMVDDALAQKDFDSLKIGITVLLVVYALKSLFWYSHTYLAAYVGQSIAQRIRNEVYEHLYSLSLGFFNKKTSGGILSRLTNDITTLQITLATAPTVLIRDGLTIVGLIGFLFYLNVKFALICFSILPLAAIILTHLGKKSRKAGREGQAKMAGLYEIIQESLTGMPVVKTFQNEKKEVEGFGRQNRNYFNAVMRLVRVEARSSPIMEVLGSIILSIMILIGGRDVINGAWTLGSFMAFVGAAMSLYNPIKKFAKVNVQMQLGLASAERVFELKDQKATVFDKKNAQDASDFSDSIEFKNVSFAYSSQDPTVLNDINIKMKKGEVLALVGASGSGKTTIAQLLLRFYDPTQGAIQLDGFDLRDLKTDSYRRQMAVVTQETHLFNDTVQANIAYGRGNASQKEIEDAAKAAYAHDFIQALPNGYQTVIGERGTRLSGGERQRIAIARSLLKNPSILILDEATSALDAKSEQEVQRALDRLLEGRTVLIIAHRLTTVRKADRIIVLENGRIKESGNHAELIQKKGTYHKLYELHAIQ